MWGNPVDRKDKIVSDQKCMYDWIPGTYFSKWYEVFWGHFRSPSLLKSDIIYERSLSIERSYKLLNIDPVNCIKQDKRLHIDN